MKNVQLNTYNYQLEKLTKEGKIKIKEDEMNTNESFSMADSTEKEDIEESESISSEESESSESSESLELSLLEF